MTAMTLTLKDPSLLESRAYINGAFEGEGTVAVTNPATGAVLARVPNCGAAETTRAVDCAGAAMEAWAARVAKERSQILRRWFDLIIANRDDLA